MADPFRPYDSHQIIHFRYVDGMTEREIAELTGYGVTHIENVLREARKSTTESAEILRERRAMWQARLEHIYARLKKNLDIITDYDAWLDTVKTILATTAMSSRIDQQMEAALSAGSYNNKWLSSDVDELSDQQILELAQRHGVRLPAVGPKEVPMLVQANVSTTTGDDQKS